MENADDVRNIVSQILQSPQLRDSLENTVRAMSARETVSPEIRIQEPRIARQEPIREQEPRPLRQELNRLFPSIRGNSARSRMNSRHSKNKTQSTFNRDVILVKNPNMCGTLKGNQKSRAYETGMALTDVKFECNWNKTQITNYIADLFSTHLGGKNFNILVPLGGRLMKPNLPSEEELEGHALRRIFNQKPIYIRPCQEIVTATETTACSAIAPSIEINENNLYSNEFQCEIDMSTAVQNSINESSNCNRNPVDSRIDEHSDADDQNTVIIYTDDIDMFDPTSLGDIIKHLSKHINEDQKTYFNVFRQDIYGGYIRAVRRPNFSPCDTISVLFTDADDNSEGAVDLGGPKREMFRLLLQYIQNTQVFEGPENKKYIALNADAFERREYFEAGRLIALSMIHVGLGPHFFSELLFNALTQEFDNLQPIVDDINDNNIRNEIVMAQSAPNLEAIQSVLNNGTYFSLAGWEIINDFSRKDKMIKDVLKFYLLERCSKYLDQFTEGLKTLDVHKYMTKYPEYFLEIMCKTLEKLTFEDFEQLFKIDYSVAGSNQRQTESRIIAFWKDYILDCSVNLNNEVNKEETEDTSNCTLEEILIFCTGSQSVPAMGFNATIVINFLHNDCSRFTRGNTCGLELHLPIIHQNYENFKKDVNFGIKNGSVFALA